MSNRTKRVVVDGSDNSATIDVHVDYIRDNAESILVTPDGEHEEWLPKTLAKDNGNGTFSMPYWLALDHGLI